MLATTPGTTASKERTTKSARASRRTSTSTARAWSPFARQLVGSKPITDQYTISLICTVTADCKQAIPSHSHRYCAKPGMCTFSAPITSPSSSKISESSFTDCNKTYTLSKNKKGCIKA